MEDSDQIKGGWDTRPEEYVDLGLSIGLPPNIIPKSLPSYQYASILLESLYNDELGGFNSLVAPALRYKAGKSILISYSEKIENICTYINIILSTQFDKIGSNYITANRSVGPCQEILNFEAEFYAQYVISNVDIFPQIKSASMLPIDDQTTDYSLQMPARGFSTNVAVVGLDQSDMNDFVQKHHPHVTGFAIGSAGIVFNVDSPSYAPTLIADLRENYQATKLLFPGPTPCPHPIFLERGQAAALNYVPTLSQALAPIGMAPALSTIEDIRSLPLYSLKILYVYNAIDKDSLRDVEMGRMVNKDMFSYFSRFGTISSCGFIAKAIGITAVYAVRYAKPEYAMTALHTSLGMRYMGRVLIFQLRQEDL